MLIIYFSFIIVFLNTFVFTENEVIPCQKLSFDSEDMNDIERCPGVNLNEMTKKQYANSKVIRPFREGAKYYLANKVYGLSCEQTKETFLMDQNSMLQMTNFLYFTPGAYLIVRVMDLDDLDEYGFPQVAYEWKMDGDTREWQIFNRTIDKRIPRGKVQMECNINSMSTLAIEHLHIVNPSVEDEECQEEVWYPEQTTSTSSTTQQTTTTEIITSEETTTTQVSTSELTTTEEVTTQETPTIETSTDITTTEVSTTEDSTTVTTIETTEITTTEDLTTTTIETTEITTTEDLTTKDSTVETTQEVTTDETTIMPTTTTEDLTTEITTTEDVTTELTTIETSSTEITPESTTFSTISSSTEIQPPEKSNFNPLYLYLLLILATTIIIVALIVLIFFFCKNREENNTAQQITHPSEADTISITSDFSIFSYNESNKQLTSQIPRLDFKRNKNDSGLNSDSIESVPSWIVNMRQ